MLIVVVVAAAPAAALGHEAGSRAHARPGRPAGERPREGTSWVQAQPPQRPSGGALAAPDFVHVIIFEGVAGFGRHPQDVAGLSRSPRNILQPPRFLDACDYF